jgi:hypothetical protein
MRNRFPVATAMAFKAILIGALLVLPALPATGAGLTVGSLQVAFDDGEKARVLSQGEGVTAYAEVAFRGSGLLSGIWEIAVPAKDGQTGKYRSLEVVNKDLAATENVKLQSPKLPTDSAGTYALRFKITRPVPEREGVVRYFVGQEPSDEVLGGRQDVPEAIGTRSPSAAAGNETTFSWDPVPGSIGYQVEIYDESGSEDAVVVADGTFGTCLIRHPSELNRPPLVGLMAPGYQTEATITQLAGSALTSGGTYLWRVVALGPRGKVLCESPFRKFTFRE